MEELNIGLSPFEINGIKVHNFSWIWPYSGQKSPKVIHLINGVDTAYTQSG